MFTFKEFVVYIPQLQFKEPEELSKEIIELMCVQATDSIFLQCGREYGFSKNPKQDLRATDISTLLTAEQEVLQQTTDIPKETLNI